MPYITMSLLDGPSQQTGDLCMLGIPGHRHALAREFNVINN